MVKITDITMLSPLDFNFFQDGAKKQFVQVIFSTLTILITFYGNGSCKNIDCVI